MLLTVDDGNSVGLPTYRHIDRLWRRDPTDVTSVDLDLFRTRLWNRSQSPGGLWLFDFELLWARGLDAAVEQILRVTEEERPDIVRAVYDLCPRGWYEAIPRYWQYMPEWAARRKAWLAKVSARRKSSLTRLVHVVVVECYAMGYALGGDRGTLDVAKMTPDCEDAWNANLITAQAWDRPVYPLIWHRAHPNGSVAKDLLLPSPLWRLAGRVARAHSPVVLWWREQLGDGTQTNPYMPEPKAVLEQARGEALAVISPPAAGEEETQ